MNKPLHFSTPDDREEIARAEVYGLLSQLFYAPPSAQLYAQLQLAPTVAPTPGAFLEGSWTGLVAATRRLTPEQIHDEYAALFGGIGKPEVFLYGSYFIAGALNEKPLAALRRDLQELGLERPQAVSETEDHLASLCEVMRYLIAGDELAVCNLTVQRRFFNAHLRAWIETLLTQLAEHPRADFYRALALFAQDYFSVEGQAFDLVDA